MSDKTEHLRMIQNIIDRMARNSLQIKCWSIAILTAFVALSEGIMITAALVPLSLFCIMDAKYLYSERMYRSLYDDVRGKGESGIDYSMDIKNCDKELKRKERKRTLSSWSIILFYPALIVTIIVIALTRTVM